MTLFCLTYIACCSYFAKCRCDVDLRGVLVQIRGGNDKVSASTSGKANGLLKLIVCKDVVLYAYFLTDVLTVLAQLSKMYQERNASASIIHGSLDETLRGFRRFETK